MQNVETKITGTILTIVVDRRTAMNHLAAHEYLQLRASRPDVPARVAWSYINGDYPDAQNVDQAMCRHDWAINDESDRCYCLNCGADGDA